MKKNLIGTMLIQLRKQNNLTQQEIADHLHCTREYISHLENNKRGLADIHIMPLSTLLKFNFNLYIKNAHRFHCISHYLLVKELMDLVTDAEFDKIEDVLQNNPLVEEFNYPSTYMLKVYLQAMVDINNRNDYKSAEGTLLSLLDINEREEIQNFQPIIYNEDRYYSCINLLACTLVYQEEYEYASLLLSKTILFFENMYFNKYTFKSAINIYYQRIYILMINNLADILFQQQKLSEALEMCNKGLKFLSDFELSYVAELILKLKVEILYKLENYDDAKITFDKFKIVCDLKQCDEYFIEVEKQFKEEYKLISLT